jgi:regulation of enolase protein 1 (concanavalin A-like superfamily)
LDLTVGDANTLSLWIKGTSASQSSFTGTGPFTLSAIGGNIGGVSDQFFYVYKKLRDNATVTVRVDSFAGPNNLNNWAKMGIMIRENVNADSSFASMYIVPTYRPQFQYRASQGIKVKNSYPAANSITLPHWIRITRKGNTFTGEHSADGKTWEATGTANIGTIPMGTVNGEVLVGFALAPFVMGDNLTANFSNLTIDGAVTGDWTQAEIGLNFNTPDSLYITVEDTNGKSYTSVHADSTVNSSWTQIKVDTSDIASSGVDLKNIKKIIIGVGNKTAPVKTGTGTLYIDDLAFGRPLPVQGE